MITLRPYQEEAVTFLTEGRRRILGDDVGLGKTYSGLAAALKYADDRMDGNGILIVIPPHLMQQWLRSIRHYSPDARVKIIFRGMPKPDYFHQIFVVTYNTLQNAGRAKTMWIWQHTWDSIVFDEAHRVRNYKSQQTVNARDIPAYSKFLMTGSPMGKEPSEIFGLLQMCDPTRFRSYKKFLNHFFYLVETPWKTEVGPIYESKREEWQKLLDEYMLRRMKSDHLDLPPVLPAIHVPIEPSPAVRKMHAEAKKTYTIQRADGLYRAPNAAALASALRQEMSQGLPSAAKIKALNEILDDLPPTESFIIYTWFRESAELVYQELLKRNETSFKIDGSLDSRGRDLVVQDWKRYPGTGLVGTLASMSEGLDLFNANIAIFFEHDYVPKTLEQAVGRLDRSGQTKPVTIYHIYHQRTIEAAVLRVAERRADSIAEAISGDWEDEDF